MQRLFSKMVLLESVPILRKCKEHTAGHYNWQYFLWNVLSFQPWLHNHDAGLA